MNTVICIISLIVGTMFGAAVVFAILSAYTKGKEAENAELVEELEETKKKLSQAYKTAGEEHSKNRLLSRCLDYWFTSYAKLAHFM